MKTSILTLLAAALLCTACVNELTPDFSDMEGELTINAFLFTDRDTNYVYVSETSRRKPQPVNNAKVEMRVNDVLVETVDRVTPSVSREVNTDLYGMNVSSDTAYTEVLNGMYRLTTRFGEGDVVRIDVYSSDRHAWAEETAPRKIQNTRADYKLANHTIYEYEEQVTHTYVDFTVGLNDISQNAEYYRIAAYGNYGYNQTHWLKKGTYYDEYSNPDSICDELRKKYELVVPIEFTDGAGYQGVDVFYMCKEYSHFWSYGSSIDYDYSGDPILSEGEMAKSSDDDTDYDLLVSSIRNKHKVFTDRLFNNSAAEIRFSVRTPFGNLYSPIPVYTNSDLERLPDDYLLKSGTTYNMKVKVSVESISENQYYYLKALNVVESEGYEDISTLSGALKVPSNVNGGCGNICLTTSTVFEFTVLDNFVRDRVIEEAPIYYWE